MVLHERAAPRAPEAPPIKVVRVIARLNVGGPAPHVTWLDDGLRRRGFDPVLVYGPVGPAEASLEDRVESLQLRARKVPDLGRRIRLWSDVRALSHLTRLVFRERPDVVHTHTAKAGALGRLAALAYNLTRRRQRRCVVFHTFHGHVLHGYFGPLGTIAVRAAERALARITDRVVTISAQQKDDISSRYRIAPPHKTLVIELGLDLDALLRLEGDGRSIGSRLEEDSVVFGYVGRLARIKDLPTLLEAFASAASRTPRARLVLVGDGEERADLERRAATLGIADRVRFTGWQRDLAAVHGGIDVSVLSSLNEGTPVAIIEAMAAARPVIATDVGGVRDVVTHGRTGLVVPPRDVPALAAAMERLAGDGALREAFGRAGREVVRERFSRERLATEIAQHYREALTARRGPGRRT
jgi:glycosyltransferase involved in cell wall biosynthesis